MYEVVVDTEHGDNRLDGAARADRVTQKRLRAVDDRSVVGSHDDISK